MPSQIIPAIGQYGLIADQPPHELPVNAFSSVSNFRFRDGLAERFMGHQQVFTTPSVTPYFITPYATSTARYWVHCGVAKVYADDGTTRTDITGTAPTGAQDDRWIGSVLGGVLILNNGKDVPQYWGGTGTLATLTGWNANWRCKSLRTFKVYAIALGMTKTGTAYPYMVKWSAAAQPGSIPSSWDETDATKDAGELDVAQTPDLLVDGLELGDAFIIYKEASMYRMEYVGGQSIFAIKRLPGNYGMLARGCVANTPKGHVVLANGDIVLVDGISEPQSLLTGRLKRWFFGTELDSTYSARSFVVSNPSKNEVWICYPRVGSSTCTRALVWNWQDGTIGQRDLPNATWAASGLLNYSVGNSWGARAGTWADASGSWNSNDFTPNDHRLIFTTTGPNIFLADSTNYFNGSAVSAMLERTGLTFDDPDTDKLLKSITPRIQAPAGTVVNFQFGASNSSEVAPTWGTPVSYTVGQTPNKVFAFARGKYLAYRAYSTSVQPWVIKSMDMDVQAMGKW